MNCCNGNKAIVEYTQSTNKRVIYETNKVPIEITVEPATAQGTYRFYGTGDDGLFYEFIASGNNPGYALNSGFNGRGYTPTMNGVFIKPQTYYYVSGYGIEEIVKPRNNCQIKITGNGNNFTDDILCPDGSYQVSCDDDCPPGHHKCKHDKYPGYCCISCKDTASKIKGLVSKIVNK